MKSLFKKSTYILPAAMLLFACGGKETKKTTAAVEAKTSKTKTLEIEKPQLTFGFIKLTDMAPLAIAKEKGFFEDEGLFVSVEAQSNWKNILDRVIDGQLDGSHMLAGQPIAAGAGFGRQAKLVTTFSMDLNGNAITVSNDVWSKMKSHVPKDKDGKPVHPIKAEALKPVITEYKNSGKAFKMGMVFPVSTHNYEIRYWLAAAGINPGMYTKENVQGQIDAEVLLSVTPPPQMPATLEAGTIHGYCVGEPWNQQAVFKGIGVPVVTNYDIWKNNPEKVFVMTQKFIDENPNTAIAVTKALIRAGKWLDEPTNRAEAVKILSMSQYVGAPEAVLENSMSGTF
jgi:nitrate/nitrite transport system substrate-binding protein